MELIELSFKKVVLQDQILRVRKLSEFDRRKLAHETAMRDGGMGNDSADDGMDFVEFYGAKVSVFEEIEADLLDQIEEIDFLLSDSGMDV